MKSQRSTLQLLAVIAAFSCQASPAAAPAVPSYQVTKTVALGAPDRWDYVVFDSTSHRVYVAHGDRVSVVDGLKGTVIGQVEGYAGGTHGIAIVGALGQGFTDDGRAGEAGAFDLKTFKTLRRIKAADDADGIVFDPVSGHVFVINGDSGSVTVIDPRQEAAALTVQAGGKLEAAVAGADGKVYVNGAAKSEIVRLDTKSNRIDAHWPIANCKSPHGIAIDSASHRLFSSCVNNVLVVVNLDTGSEVASVPIGSGTDAAAFDPTRKLVFSSNGRDGTLSIIREKDADHFETVATLKTAVSARTMDVDPVSGRIYLAAAELENAPPAELHAGTSGASATRKPGILPGSLKLLFLDPTP
jgi:DNA-binding beta-propeller fold protein YncE